MDDASAVFSIKTDQYQQTGRIVTQKTKVQGFIFQRCLPWKIHARKRPSESSRNQRQLPSRFVTTYPLDSSSACVYARIRTITEKSRDKHAEALFQCPSG